MKPSNIKKMEFVGVLDMVHDSSGRVKFGLFPVFLFVVAGYLFLAFMTVIVLGRNGTGKNEGKNAENRYQ
jgi:hypothetical protein